MEVQLPCFPPLVVLQISPEGSWGGRLEHAHEELYRLLVIRFEVGFLACYTSVLEVLVSEEEGGGGVGGAEWRPGDQEVPSGGRADR